MEKELRFIVDTQLPPVLATFLRPKEFDAVHTTSFADGHLLADEQIRRIAIEQQRIVITKDTDFPEQFFLNGPPPNVLYLTIGNIRNNDLIDWLDKLLHKLQCCSSQGPLWSN